MPKHGKGPKDVLVKSYPRWKAGKPPVEAAFLDWVEREMVCSLIRKQMSKRDDGYGSVRS